MWHHIKCEKASVFVIFCDFVCFGVGLVSGGKSEKTIFTNTQVHTYMEIAHLSSDTSGVAFGKKVWFV